MKLNFTVLDASKLKSIKSWNDALIWVSGPLLVCSIIALFVVLISHGGRFPEPIQFRFSHFFLFCASLIGVVLYNVVNSLLPVAWNALRARRILVAELTEAGVEDSIQRAKERVTKAGVAFTSSIDENGNLDEDAEIELQYAKDDLAVLLATYQRVLVIDRKKQTREEDGLLTIENEPTLPEGAVAQDALSAS